MGHSWVNYSKINDMVVDMVAKLVILGMHTLFESREGNVDKTQLLYAYYLWNASNIGLEN